MSFIEMKIASIGMDQQGDHVVVLCDSEMTKALPIWIGQPEARAITLALRKQQMPRPLTHQLVLSVIEQFNYKLKQILLDELNNGTFLAKIVLEPSNDDQANSESKLIQIDARPSDAIALATITEVPIFVVADVMKAAAVDFRIRTRKDLEDSEAFKSFIKGVKASDFKLDGPLELPEE
jgi:uncharacterized protein